MMVDDSTELVEAYDYLLKVVVIGESGTGKSCLLHQFLHSTWKASSQQTIGVEFASRTIALGERTVKLQLWDTAGQERFRSVTRSYYRGTSAALLCYSIASRSSFLALPRWLADVRALGAPQGVQVVVVGCQSDRAEEEREVTSLEAARWAEENNVIHLETSSLTPHQPHLPFQLASRAVLLAIERGELDPDRPGSGVAFGERQLRSWGASSAKAAGGGWGAGAKRRTTTTTPGGRGGGGVELSELVGDGEAEGGGRARGRRCC